MKQALLILIASAAISLAICAPASADSDTEFADVLHTYGIYGPKDYNAWIGKLACKRLSHGIDTTAQESVTFVSDQLAKNTTTEHGWEFLGTAIDYYCPQQRGVLNQEASHA
ncbi:MULTISPECIES: DUF732 domain-containing protein [unclassified Mycolicibacterium]|uniref:DUF732 domain-containing protein n=1 Tax=unclassified Mycolicibacterium TaxID=2636767 RepID=UPI002ED7FE01